MTVSLQMVVDFGEVISLGQRPGVMRELAGLFTMPEATFADGYWRHRLVYDDGLDALSYWAAVTGNRNIPAELIGQATDLDVAAWTRLNEHTLDVLRVARAAGADLTLLSNAPEAQAAHVERLPEIQELFDQMVFSARIGVSKPDPAIYAAVADALPVGAPVLFVDDRQQNLDAAGPFGWTGIRFESAQRFRSTLNGLCRRRSDYR